MAEKQHKECYMFFNCDEWESDASMNVRYNDVVYRNRDGRRALWKKVKEEYEDGAVLIDEENLSSVRSIILNGYPPQANDMMTYGHIEELEFVS